MNRAFVKIRYVDIHLHTYNFWNEYGFFTKNASYRNKINGFQAKDVCAE